MRRRGTVRRGAWLLAGLLAAAGAPAGEEAVVPAWLYPANSATAGPKADPGEVLHLEGSGAAFTRAELANLFSAPDWHATEHAPSPAIVARGRAPQVYACGYCHTPTGQGRPENAPLAGLTAAYIAEQVAAFASGRRRGASAAAYPPSELMIQVAKHLKPEETAAAADYFARQTPQRRARIIESARVPRSRVIGLVYAAIAGGGEEPLGPRLLEFAPDPERHELRDDRMQYLAYVPPGSIARGGAIARAGVAGPSSACESCHGPKLKGMGPAPSLAGRSPTYLLRSLYAFKTGRREAGSAVLMQPVTRSLSSAQMIDAVAYAASLPP